MSKTNVVEVSDRDAIADPLSRQILQTTNLRKLITLFPFLSHSQRRESLHEPNLPSLTSCDDLVSPEIVTRHTRIHFNKPCKYRAR